MTLYRLDTELWLPKPRAVVFPFFADAGNLQRITPNWLSFEILTPKPIPMHVGARIDYRLRFRGLPLRWQSEITAWEPPFRFIDEQRRGPYRIWKHEHRFKEKDGGTLCTDHIQYAVWGGALVNRFFVRRDVTRIFEFRQATLKQIFAAS